MTTGMDWLSPLADEAVKGYLADPRADAAIAASLKTAWEIRQGLVKATEKQQTLAVETAERRRATEETRANLKALEKNSAAADLRAKLTSRLAADSARLDVLGKSLVEVGLKVNEGQIRFQEAIRAIKLMQPLPAA
jgi:biotin carboxyl carrier protein